MGRLRDLAGRAGRVLELAERVLADLAPGRPDAGIFERHVAFRWDARGRHTSVHRQLVVRQAGGLIIDTPGLRELQLWDAGDAAFADTFGDIASLAADCRFRDCRHDREPGCAVKAAVEAGTLDSGRYESYLKLQREQAAFERNRDERAGIEAKRQAKLGSKAYKALQKQRGR